MIFCSCSLFCCSDYSFFYLVGRHTIGLSEIFIASSFSSRFPPFPLLFSPLLSIFHWFCGTHYPLSWHSLRLSLSLLYISLASVHPPHFYLSLLIPSFSRIFPLTSRTPVTFRLFCILQANHSNLMLKQKNMKKQVKRLDPNNLSLLCSPMLSYCYSSLRENIWMLKALERISHHRTAQTRVY